MRKLIHILDPLRTRFIPLAVVMVLGNDGRIPWSGFVFLVGLWLEGLLVLTVLRPPGGKARLQLTEENPLFWVRVKEVFKGWYLQHAIANIFWRLNLPTQMPLRFLTAGALAMLLVLLIVRKELISAVYRHVIPTPAARAVAFLSAYCLIAVFVRLTLREFLLLECVWLLLEVTLTIALPRKSETA
jgi:hypothetical protein